MCRHWPDSTCCPSHREMCECRDPIGSGGGAEDSLPVIGGTEEDHCIGKIPKKTSSHWKYWVGQNVRLGFFHKLRHIFHFHQLYWFGCCMSAISCYWLLVGRGEQYRWTSSSAWDSPTARNYLAKMSIASRNFANHFWHVPSVTVPSPFTAQILFLRFSCVFTFREIIQHNIPKMLHIFFHL